MNVIANINAKKLTSVAGIKLKRKSDAIIDNGEESSSTKKSTSDNFDNLYDASSNRDDYNFEEIEQLPLTYSMIKKTIINKAEEIHAKYQMNQKVSPGERRLMSCGSSLILDIIDKSESNEYKRLFSLMNWNKIISKFETDLLLPEAVIPKKLMVKWEYATGLSYLSNAFEDSQVFLSSTFAQLSQNSQRLVIKLFIFVFDTVQNNPYIMQQEYPENISEGDYLDQIWLPIFKSLFAINGNCGKIL